MSWRRAMLTVVAAGCVFAAGWVTGASGRAASELGRLSAERDAAESHVRAAILAARVHLYTADFGQARARLREARAGALGVQAGLREIGLAERAGQVEIVLAHLSDADRLASAMNPDAQTRAADALAALDAASSAR